RHWIIARLARGYSANAPTRKKACVHEAVGDAVSPGGIGQTHGEDMAGIAAAHLALPLLSVECQRVGTDLLAPEGAFKAYPQFFRLLLQQARTLDEPQLERALRSKTLGREHVSLHFSRGNRSLGQAAVGVKDGIVRILPRLVRQSRCGGARIL